MMLSVHVLYSAVCAARIDSDEVDGVYSTGSSGWLGWAFRDNGRDFFLKLHID